MAPPPPFGVKETLMTIYSEGYFAKTKALAMGIQAYRECSDEEQEAQFKIVGRLLARYEAQIIADMIEQQIQDEVEKYGTEEFARVNGYAFEGQVRRPPTSSEPEEVREG
jgi:ABC-type transporter MlaC component